MTPLRRAVIALASLLLVPAFTVVLAQSPRPGAPQKRAPAGTTIHLTAPENPEAGSKVPVGAQLWQKT
ncbi:MAG: hypothetical protein ACRD2J_11180 [Thermoanaerobaculia bacterium]